MASSETKHGRTRAPLFLAIFVLLTPLLKAQTTYQDKKPGQTGSATTIKTFYLKNVPQLNDSNEIMVALRNMLDPRVKVYLVDSQRAIVLEASPDQLELAQRLINDLDRPRKSYRLNFTISEFDGGKHAGTRHVAIIAAVGQRVVLKQGDKVPVMTGSYDSGTAIEKMQVTYLDVGLNFDTTFVESGAGLSLKSKVEESSISDDKSGIGAEDPIVRQTVLEGTSALVLGKPATLGSLEEPDSSRRLEIAVIAEPLP